MYLISQGSLREARLRTQLTDCQQEALRDRQRLAEEAAAVQNTRLRLEARIEALEAEKEVVLILVFRSSFKNYC